jgi:beta-galactosidase
MAFGWSSSSSSGGGGRQQQQQQLWVGVTNKYAFLDSGHLAFSWRLLAGGLPVGADALSKAWPDAAVSAAPACSTQPEQQQQLDPQWPWSDQRGWMQLQLPAAIPPGGCASLALPVGAQQLLAAAAAAAGGADDVAVEVRASLAADSSWAHAGHVVAYRSLPLLDVVAQQQQQPAAAAAAAPPAEVLIEQQPAAPGGDVRVSVPGTDLVLVVSGASGCISLLQQGGHTLLQDVAPCFMRASTDNDRGGSGGSSYAARWVAAGLDRLAVSGQVRVLLAGVVQPLTMPACL